MTQPLQAIEQLIHLDLGAFQGLPEALTPAILRARYPAVSEDEGSGYLGEDFHEAAFRAWSLPAFRTPLQVWTRDDRVVKIDAEDPVGGFAALEVLGAPEARLDLHHGVALLSGGEWVYPARGLSLGYRADGTLVRVVAYRPTSLAAYCRDIRHAEAMREFREEEGPDWD